MSTSGIGFAEIAKQLHKRSVKKGFEFTMMVVGETGLGKSTMVNSLFLTDLYQDREVPPAHERVEQTVDLTTRSIDIEENGVRLRLNVVDTPGFGDAVNNRKCWEPIVNYINSQFDHYLRDESGLNRRNIVDNRVHCCLYFISPLGHGLKPLDIEVMKQLHDKVNIIPVISKADMLTSAELKRFKRKVLEEISENGINIYMGGEMDEDENRELKECTPFAVVSSNSLLEVSGKRVRGRLYPWGVVEVENGNHCDFSKLRNVLIRTHMQDLKDMTVSIHYENYRSQRLAKSGRPFGDLLPPEETPNLSDADRKLAEKEQELQRMREMMELMQRQMRAQQSQNV